MMLRLSCAALRRSYVVKNVPFLTCPIIVKKERDLPRCLISSCNRSAGVIKVGGYVLAYAASRLL